MSASPVNDTSASGMCMIMSLVVVLVVHAHSLLNGAAHVCSMAVVHIIPTESEPGLADLVFIPE